MTKTCLGCSKEKDTTLFHTQRRKGKSQPYSKCKECFRKVQAVDYIKTRSKRASSRLHRIYGVTKDAYAKLLINQKGVCAICSRPPGKRLLAVDHNHSTSEVRGLLCGPCNQGLGLFYDNVETIEKAITYLKQFIAPK